MDVAKIKTLIGVKAVATASYSVEELSAFERFLRNADIRDYLTECLPQEHYAASGIGVAALKGLEDENLSAAAPGMYIFPRGYLVVATSVGGNAVCFHESGAVYWFDHTGFYDDRVSYKNRRTQEWIYEDMTDESIARAGVLLSQTVEPFLEQLLRDDLTERLDELD